MRQWIRDSTIALTTPICRFVLGADESVQWLSSRLLRRPRRLCRPPLRLWHPPCPARYSPRALSSAAYKSASVGLTPLQNIPFVEKFFRKEIHPADNVSPMRDAEEALKHADVTLAFLNALADNGRTCIDARLFDRGGAPCIRFPNRLVLKL